MKPEYYTGEYRKYTTFMLDGFTRIVSDASDDYKWRETLLKDIPLKQLGMWLL